MTSILCLAHYCDLHGPTPLMVTEGLKVPCGVCPCDGDACAEQPDNLPWPHSTEQTPTNSLHATKALSEALRKMDLAAQRAPSSRPSTEAKARRSGAASPNISRATSNLDVETPPHSPQRTTDGKSASQPSHQSKRDLNFRRTYDETDNRRAAPCDNCALTLPRRQESGRSHGGYSGDSSSDERGPTLRTRTPFARVYASGEQVSPPDSQASSSSVSEDEGDDASRNSHRRTGTTASSTSRSSTSSASRANTHTHYVDYTSTHEPLASTSFSLVRASCLRTLSFETLPRQPTGSGLTSSGLTSAVSPTAVSISTSIPAGPVSTLSSGLTSSGGPIFFGDPTTGYTTAYIFRIPDVHARGHKRVYAFMALSNQKERLAMKAFNFIAAAFRDMAAWILTLAENEAEKEADSSATSSPIGSGPGYLSSASSTLSSQQSPLSGGGGSSFLSRGAGGITRRMGTGFGGSVALKQRGLAELVGRPDFFIELHSQFVRLLLELAVVLNS